MPEGSLRLKKISEWLKKHEPILFFLIVVLNALPLFLSKFYLTHDGPSHLYNSVLIRELIFGHDHAIQNVYALNHELVPNLASHLILLLANFIFPIWFSEKIVLLLYFIGLPYAFRFFLKKSAAPNLFFCSLIIPFTYSYFLYSGFYNFLLALLPFFVLLARWSSPDKKMSWRFGIKLFLWFLLLYFSHIYVFVLSLFLMGLYTLMEHFFNAEKREMKKMFRDLFFLVLVSFPFLLLTARFLFVTHIVDLHINTSAHELARALSEFSCINRPGEFVRKFSSKIGMIIGLLLIGGIIMRVLQFRKKKQPLFRATDNFLVAAFILFCLYFTVPDYFGGGMNCLRIQQLMIICFIAWIGLQIFPRWITTTAVSCILVLQFCLVYFYATENNYSKEINEWISAGEHIDKGTITLPITFSKNEQWVHSSDYLGATASISLVHNYEAGLLWFPIIWNNDYRIRMKGLTNRNPLTDDRNPAIVWMEKPTLYADNVIIWGKPFNTADSISFQSVDSALTTNYTLVWQSENLKLFKQKK
jgi:hypothetical protein